MARYLIASGTQHYLDADAELAEVPAELERIHELFVTRAGYAPELDSPLLDPESLPMLTDLEDWMAHADRLDDDVVVIYYTGHGFEHLQAHYLATASTKTGSTMTAIPTDSFLRLLKPDARVRRLLVILDVCYAGQGARDLSAAAQRAAPFLDQRQYEDDEGIWIVTAARARDTAQQSVFTEALIKAYATLAASTPPSQEYLPFELLFGLVNAELRQRGVEQRAGFLPLSPMQGSPPFLPNPRYDSSNRLVALRSAMPSIADIAAQAPSRFVGREAALAELTTALGDGGARIVTGRPGSGKSALLAEFVVRTADRPTVAVQARGKTNAALEAEVATWLDAVGDVTGGVTVVVDSLDEALEPAVIASRALPSLASRGDAIRLVVGCRTGSLPSLPFAAKRVDLDDPEYSREEDITEYVTSTLLASGHFAGEEGDAQRLGADVARRAAGSFAIAAVAATTLAADGALPTGAELDATNLVSLASAFDADLARWGEHGPRLRALLAPLAWSRGTGLPWETLWAPLANALAGPDARYGDDDVRWLLDRAGAYILETQAGGRTVFRIFHEELAAHLRNGYNGTQAEAQDAIVTTILAGVVPDADGHRAWNVAARYALEQLPGHALAAGRLDELLTDPGFLVWADVEGLVPVLAGARSTQAQSAAAVYSIASDRLRTAPSADRAATLGLVARQQDKAELADAFAPLAAGASWASRWADWAPVATHRTILRSPARIGALAVSAESGRPLVAIGTGTGAIHVIDLLTDRTVAEAQVGAWLSMLAWLGGNHPWRFAAGADDGSLHLWTALDAAPTRLAAHRSGVRAIAELVIAGRPAFVTAGQRPEGRGTLRAWDAESLAPLGPEIDAFAGTVGTLHAITHEGAAAILVTGDPLRQRDPDGAGQLRVFDPLTGELLMDLELSRFDYARTIAVDGDEVIVTWGRHLERWNLAEARRLASVETTVITPVAKVLGGSGQPVIATTSMNGVDFYDASELAVDPARAPIQHTGLDLLDAVTFAGREIVVATDSDNTVRIWNPRPREATEQAPVRIASSIAACGTGLLAVRAPGELEIRALGSGAVLAVALTQDALNGPLAVCAHEGADIAYAATSDGVVRHRLGDPEDPLTWKIPDRLTAIAAHSGDGRLLVATATLAGHGAAAVQLWDGTTGAMVGVKLIASEDDRSWHSLVFAPLRGRLAVVAAGSASKFVAWDVEEALTWQPIPMLEGPSDTTVWSPHKDLIRRLAVAPVGEHGLLLSAGDDRRLAGLDLATGRPAFCVEDAHRDWIFAVSAGRVGQLAVAATGDRQGAVRVWALGTEKPELLVEVALDVSIIGLAIADGAVHAATARGLMAVDIRRCA